MMKTQPAARPMLLFWSTAVVVLGGLGWSVFCFIDLLQHPLNTTAFLHIPLLNWLSAFVVGPLTIGMGIFILRRQPRNIVGLLMMLIGEAMLANTLRTDMDSTIILAINSFYGGIIWMGLFLLVPYFPDGRMYPTRYARIVHVVALYLVSSSWLSLLGNQTLILSADPNILRPPNPLYIPVLEPIVNITKRFGVMIVFGLIGIGLVSLISRYRDGDLRLRSQVRWLIGNMVLFAVFAVVGFSFKLYNFDTPFSAAFSLTFYTWLLLYPIIGIAYAILRHNLYDINIIIRRTLIYTVLTGILGVIYFGGVIVSQQIFQLVTGQNSDLAVVISTLLIAALFSPVRKRVQDTIDRRLYRRKYDAQQALAQFQQNLRDNVDMDTLKHNLLEVVGDTMQPDKVALWIPFSDTNSARPASP